MHCYDVANFNYIRYLHAAHTHITNRLKRRRILCDVSCFTALLKKKREHKFSCCRTDAQKWCRNVCHMSVGIKILRTVPVPVFLLALIAHHTPNFKPIHKF